MLTLSKPRIAPVLAFVTVLCCGAQAHAEEISWSATLQNHVLVGTKQNGYTNGIFVSRMRTAAPNEAGVDSTLLLEPFMNWLGAPKPTLAAASVSQVMISPRDLENPKPAPTDTPYGGALTYRSTNVYVHDAFADMLSLNIGLVGAGSGAEKTQRAIHNTNNATKPEGWYTQRPTRGLISIDAYRAWRSPWSLSGNSGWSGDFVALGGASLGNRESTAGGTLLVRYGTGLERSFPTLTRITGRTGDPSIFGEGWFTFAGFSADRLLGDRWIASDGVNNTSEPRKSQIAPMLGIVYGWGQSSLTFSIHSSSPAVRSSNDRQSYGSLTYVWHD
jgi:hypothetical protein